MYKQQKVSWRFDKIKLKIYKYYTLNKIHLRLTAKTETNYILVVLQLTELGNGSSKSDECG